MALLLGDTSYMNYDELSNLRLSGVAHIFAVSGLHIGFLATFLSFIFDKLKIRRWFKAILVTVITLTYSGICGFTPSSLRAVIMTAALLSCNALWQKYDLLEALALAAIITLLVQPFTLFTVGFILSYASVFSIAILSPVFKRALSGLGKQFSSAIAVSASAQVGTTPLLMYYFGTSSISAVLLNLVVVPFVSFLFVILFVCVVLSMLFPFFAPYLLVLPSALTFVLNLPLKLIDFERLSVAFFPSGIIVALCSFCVILFSDKVNFSDSVRIKGIVATMTLFVLFGL